MKIKHLIYTGLLILFGNIIAVSNAIASNASTNDPNFSSKYNQCLQSCNGLSSSEHQECATGCWNNPDVRGYLKAPSKHKAATKKQNEKKQAAEDASVKKDSSKNN